MAPQVLRRHREHNIFTFGLLTALVGTTIILTTRFIPFLLTGALLAGLGFAALYPIFLAVMSRELGAHSKRLAGFLFACSGMGAAILPFAVGAISSHSGSRRVGFSLAIITITALLLMSLSLAKRLPFGAPEGS
jgi:MFS family permease